MENQVEIWKALPEYAGIEVSTLGRVRTLDKMVRNGRGTRFMKGRILKPASDKDGYLMVQVKVNDKFISKKVHRLVAQAFIPNYDNLPEVNHKNCVRDDNRAINLEWCSHLYNVRYRQKYGVSQMEAAGHPLFAINLATLEVSHFRAQTEAGRALGVYHQNISKVIKGKYQQANGYWFVRDDGHAVDVVKSKLHDVGKTGLKI